MILTKVIKKGFMEVTDLGVGDAELVRSEQARRANHSKCRS